jgi:hypothetical protein
LKSLQPLLQYGQQEAFRSDGGSMPTRVGLPCEARYSGCGFLFGRREVYERMRTQLALPECNKHFGRPIVPYILPLLIPHRGGHWYLSEHYAFCERARQCGFRVMADTTIRLEHVGSYGLRVWRQERLFCCCTKSGLQRDCDL